jgi:hypothetical protein
MMTRFWHDLVWGIFIFKIEYLKCSPAAEDYDCLRTKSLSHIRNIFQSSWLFTLSRSSSSEGCSDGDGARARRRTRSLRRFSSRAAVRPVKKLWRAVATMRARRPGSLCDASDAKFKANITVMVGLNITGMLF